MISESERCTQKLHRLNPIIIFKNNLPCAILELCRIITNESLLIEKTNFKPIDFASFKSCE